MEFLSSCGLLSGGKERVNKITSESSKGDKGNREWGAGSVRQASWEGLKDGG